MRKKKIKQITIDITNILLIPTVSYGSYTIQKYLCKEESCFVKIYKWLCFEICIEN